MPIPLDPVTVEDVAHNASVEVVDLAADSRSNDGGSDDDGDEVNSEESNEDAVSSYNPTSNVESSFESAYNVGLTQEAFF